MGVNIDLLTLGRHSPAELLAIGQAAQDEGFHRLWFAIPDVAIANTATAFAHSLRD